MPWLPCRWLVNAGCLVATALTSEGICARRELRDIPIGSFLCGLQPGHYATGLRQASHWTPAGDSLPNPARLSGTSGFPAATDRCSSSCLAVSEHLSAVHTEELWRPMS